jgi:hypothetical protein
MSRNSTSASITIRLTPDVADHAKQQTIDCAALLADASLSRTGGKIQWAGAAVSVRTMAWLLAS